MLVPLDTRNKSKPAIKKIGLTRILKTLPIKTKYENFTFIIVNSCYPEKINIVHYMIRYPIL